MSTIIHGPAAGPFGPYADRCRRSSRLNSWSVGSNPHKSGPPNLHSQPQSAASSWTPVRLRRLEQSRFRRTRFPQERTVLGRWRAAERVLRTRRCPLRRETKT